MRISGADSRYRADEALRMIVFDGDRWGHP